MKKKITTLVILVLVVLLAGTGYLVVHNQNAQNKVNKESHTSQSSQSTKNSHSSASSSKVLESSSSQAELSSSQSESEVVSESSSATEPIVITSSEQAIAKAQAVYPVAVGNHFESSAETEREGDLGFLVREYAENSKAPLKGYFVKKTGQVDQIF